MPNHGRTACTVWSLQYSCHEPTWPFLLKPPCTDECQVCRVSCVHTQTQIQVCQEGYTPLALCLHTTSSERKETLKESRKMRPPNHFTAASNVMLQSGPGLASCLIHPSTLHQSQPLSSFLHPAFILSTRQPTV